jgi:hypothetical protein
MPAPPPSVFTLLSFGRRSAKDAQHELSPLASLLAFALA